ncbi:MAG: hypothetical protein EBX50_15890 [Chitinophagia bacterium]|nr:hypothetical protein [Chitinophagia bacterium]
MSFESRVVSNPTLAEYGKFVRLDNDSRFPAISVTRVSPYDDSNAFPENTNKAPLTSVEVYPKYGVITYLANASDIVVSLSSSNVDIGDVGFVDHYTTGSPVHGSIVYTNTVVTGGISYDMGAVSVKPYGITVTDGTSRITNTAAISGSVTLLNPVTAVQILNPVTDVTARITNTAAVSGSVTVLNPTTDISVTYPLDAGNLDAFGRLRVSSPTTLFDSKTLHNKSSLFWSQTAVGTGADVRFTGENTDASVTLSAAANGAYAIRQTTQRFNYQPGKSQLCLYTGVLTPVSNAYKRIGSFQSLTAAPYTPNCGLYFETQTDSPSSIAVVQQNNSFLVPTVSARRENWNIDKLDGKGPSGKTLQLSAANIFLIDYEWLGVGRTRYGFVIDGQVCYCHAFNNAGNVPGAYMLTPNLPVRAEIRQVGAGTATMKMICCSIMSEAGADFTGVTRAVDTGIAGIPITVTGNRRAAIGLRLQADKLDSVNELLNVSVLGLVTGAANIAPIRYELVANPTLGGSAVTWTNIDVNSNFQYSVVPDNTVTVTGGTVITSGYTSQGSTIDLSGFRFEKFLRLGCSVTGVRDEIWLVLTPLATLVASHASITFVESD